MTIHNFCYMIGYNFEIILFAWIIIRFETILVELVETLLKFHTKLTHMDASQKDMAE